MKQINVYFFDTEGYQAGKVRIKFPSPAQYRLDWCISSFTNFSSNLPTAVDKIWRISLTRIPRIRLQIHCNEVEVVNFFLSDETCDKSEWRAYWTRNIERITFPLIDSSEYYRLYQQGERTKIFKILIDTKR